MRQVFERLQQLRVHVVLDVPAHVRDSVETGDELACIFHRKVVNRFGFGLIGLAS